MHSACPREPDRTARGLSPGMRPGHPLPAARCPQKHKRFDFCGMRPEMWKLFQDSSCCSAPDDCLKLNSGWPTVNTLSFCSVTVSELIMPLCLRVDVRCFTNFRAVFFATQTLGKRFFLSVSPCAVNYFLTDLSTTGKLTYWLLIIPACDCRASESQFPVQVSTYGSN